MKLLAIIPARGGSKGIPNKNIISIGGKPLLAWTIEAAHKSRYLNRIIVSSDSLEILSVAKKFNTEVIKRPKKYATDQISAGAALVHALDYLKKKEKYIPDIILLLQPTSPLRTSADIDKGIDLLLKKNADAVLSVTEADNKYLKSFFMEKGILQGITNNEFPFTNRQDLPKIYMANGALFIIREKEFRKNKKFFSKKTLGYLMDKERSIDLDNLDDISAIEFFLKKMVN